MANEKLVKPEEIITTMAFSSDEYDSRFLKMFKNNIPPYDVGDIVVLDNGMEGIVTSLKAEAPSKPLVAVKNPGYDTTQIGSKFFDIDLSKEKIVILGKKTIEDKEHGDIDK